MAGPGDGARKSCFVAMPVTTPASYADDLRDTDHFSHVLKHLFTPALERAGYSVIPPKMLGAALIHAEIIKHLERADLVLADLSNHNPNVFFELGIRTSLNRPVVLVKDRRTAAIPFDLGTINVLDYDDSLATWTLDEEIQRLAEHVSNVPAHSTSGNAMWQYFGLTQRGGPAEAGSLDGKVDLLLAEVTKLRLEPAAQGQLASAGLLTFNDQISYLFERYGIAFEIIPNGSTNRYDVSVVSVAPSLKEDTPFVQSLRDNIRSSARTLGVPLGEITGL
jgi:hypothetical protein